MSKDLLELFTADELTQVPPYVHMVTDRQKLREQLSEYVQANYKLTSKAEFTEDAWRWCAIPGTRPQDFLYRLLEVVPDRWIMASIRFRRHNVRKPFVEIVHKTFPILQRSDLVRVYDRVFDSYKVFKPINIRLYDPGSGLLSMTREAELEWDFRYYGATVRDIIQNGSYTNGLSLRLERTSHISFYEEYCNIYKKLATQNNLYGPEGVWFETRERLEAALEERGLFSIIISSSWEI